MTEPNFVAADVREFRVDLLPVDLRERLDVLVLNHAIIGTAGRDSLRVNTDDLNKALEVNAVACLRVIRQCLSALERAPQAKVAFIVSKGGLQRGASGKGMLTYKVSKAAQIVLAQTLCADLEERGIAGAMINPGWVSTRIGGASAPHTSEFSAENVQSIIDRYTLEDAGVLFDWNGQRISFGG